MLILTFIVLSFLICSVPRIALDTYEVRNCGSKRISMFSYLGFPFLSIFAR